MRDTVFTSVRARVLIVEIDHPPANALSHGVRDGLWKAMDTLRDDPSVDAAILVGRGKTFPAGADIREMSAALEPPHLPDLCMKIAQSSKPIVACLHGTVLGGGFEIALAAQGRVALDGTRIGFPEVKLGLMPGAGGTQLFPRLVGVERALDMMLTGRPVTVSRDDTHGIVDGIVAGDLVSAGVAFARALLEQPKPALSATREHFSDGRAYQRAIDDARNRYFGSPTQAAARILDAVEAAPLLPFAAGMALERELFLELKRTDEANALRHALLATRIAAKPRPCLPSGSVPERIGVLGGGLMGSGISVACLDAGLTVHLVERDEARANASAARISSIYARAIKRGHRSDAHRQVCLARLTVSCDVQDLAHVDLIIDALPEDLLLKGDVLHIVGRLARPQTLIATNTSYLDIEELAGASGRPDRFLGLHFFAPAHVQPLVELAVGSETSEMTEASGYAFVRALRKTAVKSKGTPGFIGNRILTAYRAAADGLLARGASPYEIDAAMVAYGFKMGPYESLDLSGLDVSADFRSDYAARRQSQQFPISERLISKGRLGRKVGRGFYRHPELHFAKSRRPDPDVLSMIDEARAARGFTPARVSADDIRNECLLAMLNEGARLLSEGVAQRPGDVDVVMLAGFGFPKHKGGPMKAAETRGLLSCLRQLEALSSRDDFWRPAAALRDAVKNGNRF